LFLSGWDFSFPLSPGYAKVLGSFQVLSDLSHPSYFRTALLSLILWNTPSNFLMESRLERQQPHVPFIFFLSLSPREARSFKASPKLANELSLRGMGMGVGL
jgi:hypothetical protein